MQYPCAGNGSEAFLHRPAEENSALAARLLSSSVVSGRGSGSPNRFHAPHPPAQSSQFPEWLALSGLCGRLFVGIRHGRISGFEAERLWKRRTYEREWLATTGRRCAWPRLLYPTTDFSTDALARCCHLQPLFYCLVSCLLLFLHAAQCQAHRHPAGHLCHMPWAWADLFFSHVPPSARLEKAIKIGKQTQEQTTVKVIKLFGSAHVARYLHVQEMEIHTCTRGVKSDVPALSLLTHNGSLL